MNKESFLIYKSFYEPIKYLTDEQLGRLFRTIFEYQINGNLEIDEDIRMAFEFFKNQFRIDNEKWQKKIEANRENGKKGGRPKKTQEKPKNPLGKIKPKKGENENDNENVNDNDNENNNKEKYFDNEEINNIFVEFLEVRKKLKAVNSERAIKTLINKLNKYSDDIKFKMIEQSVVSSWKDVYELKEKNKKSEQGSFNTEGRRFFK